MPESILEVLFEKMDSDLWRAQWTEFQSEGETITEAFANLCETLKNEGILE